MWYNNTDNNILKHLFSCLSSDRNHEKISEYEINTTSVLYEPLATTSSRSERVVANGSYNTRVVFISYEEIFEWFLSDW